MHDDSLRTLAAWHGDPVVIVAFEGSAALERGLRARGVQVCVLASLTAAIEVLTAVPAAILVLRLGIDEPGGKDAITLVVRNFRTPAILCDVGAAESFPDRFAQFFSGPVDAQALGAAVMRHARLSGGRAVPPAAPWPEAGSAPIRMSDVPDAEAGWRGRVSGSSRRRRAA